mgnify:CR=1 FL=1
MYMKLLVLQDRVFEDSVFEALQDRVFEDSAFEALQDERFVSKAEAALRNGSAAWMNCYSLRMLRVVKAI